MILLCQRLARRSIFSFIHLIWMTLCILSFLQLNWLLDCTIRCDAIVLEWVWSSDKCLHLERSEITLSSLIQVVVQNLFLNVFWDLNARLVLCQITIYFISAALLPAGNSLNTVIILNFFTILLPWINCIHKTFFIFV